MAKTKGKNCVVPAAPGWESEGPGGVILKT